METGAFWLLWNFPEILLSASRWPFLRFLLDERDAHLFVIIS
jgi:hypothetical protein